MELTLWFVCVCLLPRNLGECFVSLVFETIAGSSLVPAPSHGEEGSGTMRITNLFCWNAEVTCINLFVMC